MSEKSDSFIRQNSAPLASRRDLLKAVAAGTAGYWVAGRGAWAADAKPGEPPAPTAPEDKVRLGIIAVAGRAEGNLNEEGNAIADQDIRAICDVDEANLAKAAKRFPKAETYKDFRKLLERTDLDAVVVSTADHCHAPASLIALSTGRHVYCEKPLAHTVEEARRVAEVAKKYKRVTQMGTQIHAGDNYRRVVELVQSGAIGPVKEVHVVLGGARWPSSPVPSPQPGQETPKAFAYDIWAGPQPLIPFAKEFHPMNWRSFWHWGTGTLGDMGCHFIDLPFWALGLKHPTKARARGPEVRADICPEWIIASWDFPQRGAQPPVTLTWYHGDKKPEGVEGWGLPQGKRTGVIFVGEKGKLFADYGSHKLLGEGWDDFKAPPVTIAKSQGHHREWLAAIRKNDPSATTCNFDYSGALAETVLLGTVAFRTGKELVWDAANLKATNAPEAEKFIRQAEYRKGWGMDVLNTL
ncbi:Gfo/Idh/MocA family protein [Humisphaera borealis]|uniref:Gfo/Idh/MocA family oxidoreductase n=1 Tax=Humisphaera borealis TaxID=2807512 RepID=A0A7M2WRK5_9BACT|nr:Gfo/Idh/MocA family oxidoreductase [Humisphaera borealis]QOV87782.1 Gfo/Idh/MocA family oxidoreductase [Humisphaera borealis]